MKLTVDEAKVILTSLRHSPVYVDAPGKSVKEDIRLAVLLQDVASIYSVNKRSILEKLDMLTPTELYAIEHWAYGYWHGSGATEDTNMFDVYARFVGSMPFTASEVTSIKQ